jgi:hypothetical protein
MTDGYTIYINTGSYEGFYIFRLGGAARICLGWVAITFLPRDLDQVLGTWWTWRQFSKALIELSGDQAEVSMQEALDYAKEKVGDDKQLNRVFADILETGNAKE